MSTNDDLTDQSGDALPTGERGADGRDLDRAPVGGESGPVVHSGAEAAPCDGEDAPRERPAVEAPSAEPVVDSEGDAMPTDEGRSADPPETVPGLDADAPAGSDAKVDVGAESASDLRDEMAALGARFDGLVAEFSQRAQGYESIIRSLQSEIEDLRKDQIRTLLKPVFERLAALHAQADSAAASCADDSAAADLRFFGESIIDLLEQLDVVSLEARAGDPMTPRVHHAVRTVPTEQAEQDGTIQRVHRQGFAFAGNDRPLLPARVSVFRYRPQTPDPVES